jgi:hypothetical protein
MHTADPRPDTTPSKQVILPFARRVEPIRKVRSTVLVGAMTSLREAGHFERYAAALVPEHRDTLLRLVTGTWLPIEVALAHYRSCDALGLSDEEQAALGSATFARVRGSVLGTVLRLGHAAGVTPWAVLPHLQRFWNRAYDGGGIQVTRHGPKDCVVDVIRCGGLLETRQFRNSLRATLGGVLQIFGWNAYVVELRRPRTEEGISLRAQWA